MTSLVLQKFTKKVVNRKTKNNLFRQIKKGYYTRNTAVQLGLKTRKHTHMKAGGYKIMDMDILNENIQENVMCRKCKNAKSKMAI